MQPHHWMWITWAFGVGTGWTVHKLWLRREWRKVQSNFEPGMTITTSDGETLVVTRVIRKDPVSTSATPVHSAKGESK